MTKEDLNKVMKQYCIVSVELEDVISFVADLLYLRAREFEKIVPWAHNTINSLYNASKEVDNLTDYILEVREEQTC